MKFVIKQQISAHFTTTRHPRKRHDIHVPQPHLLLCEYFRYQDALECSDDNQHIVWDPLLCMVGHHSIGPFVQESLSDECLARVGLCCHFSLDLVCMYFCDVSHDIRYG